KYVKKNPGNFLIEFSWTPADLHFADVLHVAGTVPLPPYIKRNIEPTDKIRYQTTYADPPGSVAAPTAGLHFAPYIFKSINEKNIRSEFLTLHVGAGTFKPVKT